MELSQKSVIEISGKLNYLETKQPRSQAHIRREIRKYFKVDENKTY
jgi:hypothetical protein